jgi:hypothetical protein
MFSSPSCCDSPVIDPSLALDESRDGTKANRLLALGGGGSTLLLGQRQNCAFVPALASEQAQQGAGVSIRSR